MKKNETFEAMLANYQPNLGDSGEYMGNLQRKLDAIESVKSMYREECIRMRKRMIVAFVSGGIAGVAATLYLLLHPVTLTAPSLHLPIGVISDLSHYIPMLAIATFSVLASIICTLLYQVLNKDFSELPPTMRHLG